jgi:isopentenyl diphosphate isomerase/L-lactate dehydrogenase-like FMN-dependent dehydrogenase
MDIHGEAQQKKFSGYDMVKAGAAGAAGFGIGQAVGSKWSEHKRQQRGY